MDNVVINQEYRQIKEIEGHPFNKVGEIWRVYNITDEYIILRNDINGLGIEKKKFREYFELVEPEENRKHIVDGNLVIQNGRAIIVILPDGCKGVAKCLLEDKFDPELGYEIAYTRAKVKSLAKEIKKLNKHLKHITR